MTRTKANQSTKQMRGFSWKHENELSKAERSRIVKMHKDGYTSSEIGQAMKIASTDKRDPFRPVRHILNSLRFQGIIEGHAPRGKRPITGKRGRPAVAMSRPPAKKNGNGKK